METYIKNYIKEKNIDDFIILHINNDSLINSTFNGFKSDLKSKLVDSDIDMYNSNIYFIDFYMDCYLKNNKQKVINYNRRKSVVEYLKTLVLPEQRSAEWYSIRKKVLTASSLASVLGKCHFTSRESLILDKISDKEKPYVSNPITEWGVKYEEIATKFYEKLNNVHILEFGMIPHPTFPIFGASPDGICSEDSPIEYVGRMLEIKCPPKRKFTKTVPINYLYQVQGQLECCDLDECDFFQVKICEYDTFEQYINDKGEVEGTTSKGFPKGCVLTYQNIFELKNSYMYPPELYKNEDYFIKWNEKTKQSIEEHETKDYIETKWWYIERYECTLVKRDRNFWNDTIPHIIKFWEDVNYYKKEGDEKLIEKINQQKSKKPKYDNNVFVNIDKCMID
jgi:putative phage-type endonuclease